MSDEEDDSPPRQVPPHVSGRGAGQGAIVWRGSGTGVAGLTATTIATGAPPVDEASLLASARRHAVRGMRARHANEHDDASLQLGIMLEHLAKSYLASLHPTLLIDRSFDLLSLVRLAGQGQRINTPHVLKTIGLQGALERIGTIQGGGNSGAGVSFARRFNLVFQARNGVAHVGDHGGAADEVAQLAVRAADEILDLAGRTLSDIFGEYTDAAVSLLDDHSTAVEQLVTLRLGHAKRAFAEQVADLSEEDREAELSATDRLTVLNAEEDDGKVPFGCPACERIGILSGSPYLELQPGAPFVDDEGTRKVLVNLRVLLSADTFRCPICRLRLHGQEQLQTTPLPTQALVRLGTEEDLTRFNVDELEFREAAVSDDTDNQA